MHTLAVGELQHRAHRLWSYAARLRTSLESSCPAEPDAKEIQVERVKFLRYGEARGDYDQVVAAVNG
ncbi:hypothetical protein ACE1SV_58620 [Streptomyces sennicomposti]